MQKEPEEVVIGFGTALRLRRKTAGLTQRELGELLGTDASTISRYEKMETAPKDRHILERLSQILHTTIDDLLRGEIVARRPSNLLKERAGEQYDAIVEYPRLQWLLSVGWRELSDRQKGSVIDFFEYQVDRAARASRGRAGEKRTVSADEPHRDSGSADHI